MPDNPEFIISPVRILTLPEQRILYVRNQPTPMANLDRDLDVMIEQLEAAQKLAGIPEASPVITRYWPVSELYQMELGVPAREATQPAGEGQIQVLPACLCAGLLLWGSLAHITEAYNALFAGIAQAGYASNGEGREYHYQFLGDKSSQNVIGLYQGLKAPVESIESK